MTNPPIKIDLGTRLVCEDREFIVINYTFIRDHGGYLLRFEAQDPVLALTRQMEAEKARETQQKSLDLQEKGIKIMERHLDDVEDGEEWKRK